MHGLDADRALDDFHGGDEHGILRPAADRTRLPGLGQVLLLIPGHCDPTVNLSAVMIDLSGGLRNGPGEPLIRVDSCGARA